MKSQYDDDPMMSTYVRKRPDLVIVFDGMMSAFDEARKKGKGCQVRRLEPLYDALVHPSAQIWYVAIQKAYLLSEKNGPIFQVLERVVNHPKADVRRRVRHCLDYRSVKSASMAIVDTLATDKAVKNRVEAYWMGLRIMKQKLLPRVERYAATEKNNQGIVALNEIRQFIRDGYLLEPGSNGSMTVYAFCAWGYYAWCLTKEQFKSMSLAAIVKQMGERKIDK